MKVYLFDEQGFLIGPHKCQESPLEPGHFLKPVNCTDVEPPKASDDFKSRFQCGAWIQEVNLAKQRRFILESGATVEAQGLPPGAVAEITGSDELYPLATAYVIEAEKGPTGLPVARISASKLGKAKKKAERHAKLAAIRATRETKLADVDAIIKDIVLGDSEYTAQQVKAYRKALKNITDPYKDFDTDTEAAARLDALDVATMEWPTI